MILAIISKDNIVFSELVARMQEQSKKQKQLEDSTFTKPYLLDGKILFQTICVVRAGLGDIMITVERDCDSFFFSFSSK